MSWFFNPNAKPPFQFTPTKNTPDSIEVSPMQYQFAQQAINSGGSVSLVSGKLEISGFTPAAIGQKIEQAMANKQLEIDQQAPLAIQLFLGKSYPAYEQLTWREQYSEAKSYTTWVGTGSQGSAPPTPTLSAVAFAYGETVAQLTPVVIDKATKYNIIVASVSAQRKVLSTRLKRLTTLADVVGLTVHYINPLA